MNKIFFSVLFGTLLLVSFSGCQNTENADTSQLMTAEVNESEISATQTHDKLGNDNKVVLMDVRTQEEYDEYHLSDAVLMPLQTLEQDLSGNNSLNKNDEIIVYCRSGKRSMEAYNILKKLGYTNVKSMTGGINQWSALGYNTCSGEHMTC